MDYIGIDVHKRESQICILGSDGEIIERRVRTSAERFGDVLGVRPPARVLIEASTESEWVARILERLGHDVIVADPNFAPMYATRSKKIKTDRRDALAPAQACKLGAYKPSFRRSDAQRIRHAHLVVRRQLVAMRARSIVTARALMRQHGVDLPRGGTDDFAQRTKDLPLDSVLKELFEPLRVTCERLSEQIDACDERIKLIARDDPRVERLCTVPGVAALTATAFVALVDEAGRFGNAHQLEAYVGLVPGESSSGDGKRRTRITKAGSSMVRTLLVQAALALLKSRRADSVPLQSWCKQLSERRGKKIARIALARRLAGILYALLRDGTRFGEYPGKRATALNAA